MSDRPPEKALALIHELPDAPRNWVVLDRRLDGFMARGLGPHRTLVVISSSQSVPCPTDPERSESWHHVSVSIPGCTAKRPPGLHDLPAWTEMDWVRRHFIGEDRWAYQVHAPPAEHVDQYQVLHLWAPCDGQARLPDFTCGGTTL